MTEQTKARRFTLDVKDLAVIGGGSALAIGLAWLHPALLLVLVGALLVRMGTE